MGTCLSGGRKQRDGADKGRGLYAYHDITLSSREPREHGFTKEHNWGESGSECLNED
jgi:hypothetical protein